MAIGAIWLYAAECIRCWPVENSYKELIKKYYPEKPSLVGWKNYLTLKIGWATIYVLAILSTLLSIGNGIVLMTLEKVNQ